jgi:hypothetical protein
MDRARGGGFVSGGRLGFDDVVEPDVVPPVLGGGGGGGGGSPGSANAAAAPMRRVPEAIAAAAALRIRVLASDPTSSRPVVTG